MKTKFFKKSVALLLAASAVLPAASCFGGGGSQGQGGSEIEEVDSSKTQLYVGVYDGALGTEYAQTYAKEFEQLYADVSFEEGKKGVQVYIDVDKEGFMGGTLIATMKHTRQDVFYTCESVYRSCVEAGILGDISEVVTAKNYDANGEWVGLNKGTTTLVSRMDQHYVDSLNMGTESAPKYYALPNWACPTGFFYDVDLFEEYGYFDGGNGPDGKAGTYDDGLPATWEDFKELLDQMVMDRITPMTWAGFSLFYRNQLLNSVWAGYEGRNDFMLNSSFSGVDNTLGEITPANAYLLQKQDGKLAALTAAYDCVSNPLYYSPNAFNNSQSHLVAQEEYVFSKETDARIAMLVEASWWENEAKSVFNELGGDNAYGKREFSLMPIPRFTGTAGVPNQENTKNTFYLSGSMSLVFTNAYSPKKALADEFVGFCHSKSAMRTFTRLTGNPRAFEYDLTEEDLAAMTPMGRNVWEIFNDPNTEIVFHDYASEMRTYSTTFTTSFEWGTSIPEISATAPLYDPLLNFYSYAKTYNLTPAKYFAGMEKECSASLWEEYYNRFLEN